MSELLKLSVKFEKLPGSLAITYEVSNAGSEEVYLTNHAVRITRGVGPVPDRNLAFVSFEDGTVHITKRKPKAPQGFFTPRQHFLSVVPSGGTYTETFVIPMPIKEQIPYSSDKPDARFAERVMDRVKFSLGYIVGDKHLSVEGRQVGGVDVLALKVANPISGNATEPVTERFLIADPVKLDVMVAVATK